MARSKQSEGNASGAGDEQASPPSPKTDAASLSFEAALTSLEGVVARLESGDMPLEQALEAFEAGVALSRRCAATLDAAERRIEILMAERGRGGASGRVEAFEDSGENESGDEPEEASGDEDSDGEV
jgi:exodeoxyribonuclease VII small subunit